MKEIIYECEVCGSTLERYEQGTYKWCARCRHVWDDGLTAGLKIHDAYSRELDALGRAFIVDRVAPYNIKSNKY